MAPQRGQRIPDPSGAGTDAEHAIGVASRDRDRYEMIGLFIGAKTVDMVVYLIIYRVLYILGP